MSISYLISPYLPRRSFSLLELLVIHLVISCTWFCNGTFESYSTRDMTVNVDYDMFEAAFNESLREPLTFDFDPHCLNMNQMSYMGLSNLCFRSNLFCLQSQSSSFLSKEHHSREAILGSSDVGSILENIKEGTLESQKSDMPNLFKKILYGLRVKKIYAVTFVVASLMFLRHCFMSPHIQRSSETNFPLGSYNAMETFSPVGNPTSIHQNQESESSPTYKMDVKHSSKKKNGSLVLDRSSDVECSGASQCVKLEPMVHRSDNISRENKKQESVTSRVAESAVVLNANNGDSSGIGTIAVKVGKEKRRKKRGKGSRSGAAVSIESLGRQSGYSTPPTPLSPVTTVLFPNAPNQSACYAKSEIHKNPRSSINTLTNQCSEKSAVIENSPKASDMKLSVPKKVSVDAAKKKLSTNFAAAKHPARNLYPAHFLPPSSVPPYARAPGPALCKKTSHQANGKAAVVKKEAVTDFTYYNIWGDSLFGFDRIGRPKDPPVSSLCNDSDPFSFFAKGPALFDPEVI